MVRTFGVEGLFALRIEKTGREFIELGQEEHPDGSGPLLAPLPNIDSQVRQGGSDISTDSAAP